MTLIELYAPRGALSEDRKRQLGERLVTELLRADGAPADIIARGRALTTVIIHEPDTWTVAGAAIPADAPARYIVRVTLPGRHLNDAMRAELVRRVTGVLAGNEGDAQRLYREPAALVHIIELPGNAIGAFGQALTTADIIRLVVDPDHSASSAQRELDEPADEVVDPICGMTVKLTKHAITLVHGETTYAFCNETCRDIFAARLS